MRRAFTSFPVLLLVLPMTPAAARQRGRVPASTAPPLVEVHERSILELQAA